MQNGLTFLTLKLGFKINVNQPNTSIMYQLKQPFPIIKWRKLTQGYKC